MGSDIYGPKCQVRNWFAEPNDPGTTALMTHQPPLPVGHRTAHTHTPRRIAGMILVVAEVIKAVVSCSTGRAIFAKAKRENGGSDPVVQLGTTKFGGSTDTDSGVITLDQRLKPCEAIDVLVQELTNLASKSDFDKLDEEALNGNVSRLDFIRKREQIEFRGLQNILKVFGETKASTGCTNTTREYQRQYANSFEDYFTYLNSDPYGRAHGENIGKIWDRGARGAYENKHPRTPSR